jgi:8-oxo-dGTP diphosphatase
VSEARDRLFPPRPILSVSVAVFRAGKVLLAERARAPFQGYYSCPGGVVEIGERLEAAALRELQEEVGVEAEIVAFNDFIQSIEATAEGVRSHYVIACFAAAWRAGEPRLSEEASDCRWIEPEEAATLKTTPGLPDLLLRAASLMRAR